MNRLTSPQDEVDNLEREIAPLSTILITKPLNATEVAAATEQFKTLKAMEKKVREREQAITKPLNESLKSVRDLFTPMRDRISAMVSVVRFGLQAYESQARLTLDKQRQKDERKVAAGTITPGQAAHALTVRADTLGTGTVSTSKHRVVVIFNPELIPDKYWVINEPLVRKEALAGRDIPGVRVDEERIVVNR